MSYSSTAWHCDHQDSEDLALDETDLATVESQIQASISPIDLGEGLGIRLYPQEETLHSETTTGSSKPDTSNDEEIQRKRINQHIYELLMIEDKRRENRKRVRFDDMGASPRKRARLATQMEEFIHSEEEIPALSGGSDLLKLQMIALSSYEEEKEQLLSIIDGLEKEIKNLVQLNLRQSEQRTWVVREVLRRRATDLRKHSEFLESIAKNE